MSTATCPLLLAALSAALIPSAKAPDDPPGKAGVIPQQEMIDLGLQRELLACAEEQVEVMGRLASLANALREVGEVDNRRVAEVEADSLRAESELTLRRAEFEIRLDQLSTRFGVESEEAVGQSRKIFAPLGRCFESLRTIEEDLDTTVRAINELDLKRKPEAAREALIGVIGDGKIFEGTEVRQRFLGALGEATALASQELQARLKDLHRREQELWGRRRDVLSQGESVPDELAQEIESVDFAIAVAETERQIREIERKNPTSDPFPSRSRLAEMAHWFLSEARRERYAAAANSWPKLEGISAGSNDLLGMAAAEARAALDRHVTARGGALKARALLTRLRARVTVYGNCQREYQLSMDRVAAAETEVVAPPPAGGRRLVADPVTELLTAQRSLIAAKERLVETWAAYHRERHALSELLDD